MPAMANQIQPRHSQKNAAYDLDSPLQKTRTDKIFRLSPEDELKHWFF
jgi:hypothetical protein